jgi:hypothetical protein
VTLIAVATNEPAFQRWHLRVPVYGDGPTGQFALDLRHLDGFRQDVTQDLYAVSGALCSASARLDLDEEEE